MTSFAPHPSFPIDPRLMPPAPPGPVPTSELVAMSQAVGGEAWAGARLPPIQSLFTPKSERYYSGQFGSRSGSPDASGNSEDDTTTGASAVVATTSRNTTPVTHSAPLSDAQPSKPTRTRNTCTCDPCHSSKSKCDGTRPCCNRCTEKGLGCTYKTNVACDYCRHRKIKCDGTRPACRSCCERGLNCTYPERQRFRGPGKASKRKPAHGDDNTRSMVRRRTSCSTGDAPDAPESSGYTYTVERTSLTSQERRTYFTQKRRRNVRKMFDMIMEAAEHGVDPALAAVIEDAMERVEHAAWAISEATKNTTEQQQVQFHSVIGMPPPLPNGYGPPMHPGPGYPPDPGMFNPAGNAYRPGAPGSIPIGPGPPPPEGFPPNGFVPQPQPLPPPPVENLHDQAACAVPPDQPVSPPNSVPHAGRSVAPY